MTRKWMENKQEYNIRIRREWIRIGFFLKVGTLQFEEAKRWFINLK